MEVKTLTPRQWRLYEAIKAQGDNYIKQRRVAEILKEDYPEVEGKPFHDTMSRINMTDDIRAINNSGLIQKVIISDANGVKLVSENDYKRQITKVHKAKAKYFREYKKLVKLDRDGQYKLPIGSSKTITEAFIEGE